MLARVVGIQNENWGSEINKFNKKMPYIVLYFKAIILLLFKF